METENLNKKYDLMLEVLTPLHIGAGSEKDWILGSDFIVDDGKIKIINLKKAAQFVGIQDLTNALLKKDSNFFKDKLAENLKQCVDKEFYANYLGTNDIKTFIKNGLTNKPIVPGSSLKGAIRSILFSYLKEKDQNYEKQVFGSPNDGDEFMRFIKVSDAQFANTELINTKIFNLSGSAPNFNGGWKHEFRGGTNVSFKQNGFNTIYEILKPRQTGEFCIALSDKAFNNFDFMKLYSEQKEKIQKDLKINENEKQKRIKAVTLLEKSIASKSNIISSKLSYIFNIINNHTKSYLKKEREFFEKYEQADNTDKIINSIDSLIEQIPENGEYCILKIGAGSGFHSITGDWQFDNYSIDRLYSEYYDRNTGENKQKSRGNKLKNGQFNKSAKSRKIAISSDDEFSLMGFVKLQVIDEKMLASIEQEKENQRQIEFAKLQLQQQEQLIQEKQKLELEAKQNQFKLLISQAQSLFDNKDFKTAMSKIVEAEALNLENDSHLDLKLQIDKSIDLQTKNDAIEKLKQERAEKRIAETKEKLQGGLASYLEEKNLKNEFKVNKFGILKAKVEKYLKDSAQEKLPENELIVLEQCIKRVYNSLKNREQKKWQKFDNNNIWQTIANWSNSDFTKNIYDKLF